MPDDVFDDPIEDSGLGSGEAAPPAPAPEGTPDSKRINDLMSKWQQAEARANALEAQLKAAPKGSQAPENRSGSGQAAAKPVDEWLEYNRALVREALYSKEPRLAKYGIDPTAIEGATPAEMQASFERQKALVEKIETKARNEVLMEHGLVPEQAGGLGGAEPMDFSTMGSDEFAKFLRRMEGGNI